MLDIDKISLVVSAEDDIWIIMLTRNLVIETTSQGVGVSAYIPAGTLVPFDSRKESLTVTHGSNVIFLELREIPEYAIDFDEIHNTVYITT